ncbi:MAG: alpha-amylase family glycosyl hydrolase, partial [bacterium]
MKTKIINALFVFSIALILNSCGGQSRTVVKDIIQPINIISGKPTEKIISDMFYSKSYNVKFNPNSVVNVEFVKDSGEVSFTADSAFEGMTLVEFEMDNSVYEIPLIVKKEKYYEFNFTPNKKYNEIFLFGSFNGWNRSDIKMADTDNDGKFEASVPLEPGVHQYKFFADGIEIYDPVNPQKVPNGFGDFNSIRVIENTDTVKMFLHNVTNLKENNSVYSFILEYGKEEATISSDEVFVLLNNSEVDKDKIEITGNKISVLLDPDELDDQNLLRVAVSKDGKVSNIQNVFLPAGRYEERDSFTWYDGVIYSLMIDRFNDGDPSLNKPVVHDSLSAKANYMGGDFQGVIDKLNQGYFDSLGVNVIWISPVYDNPNEAYREYPAPNRYYSGYHGYWPIDDKRVEEHFGSMDKLKELVNIAHEHGIKILLDFVSHHVHAQHPYFENHKDWFGKLDLPGGRLNLRLWDEYRLTTWFEPYLPSFDFVSSQSAVDSMTDNAVWWLENTDADGYRHDAVKHVPNNFWRTLSQKMNKEFGAERDIPVYQIGETFGSYDLISSYVNNGQLSAQFNFNLYDVALPTFIRDEASFDGLNKEMQKTFSVYGPLHLMGNIMDSHDKNRFMAFADGDLDASQWNAPELGWNNPPVVDNPESYKKLILYMA